VPFRNSQLHCQLFVQRPEARNVRSVTAAGKPAPQVFAGRGFDPLHPPRRAVGEILVAKNIVSTGVDVPQVRPIVEEPGVPIGAAVDRSRNKIDVDPSSTQQVSRCRRRPIRQLPISR
jgi:hypothetical protein